MTIKFNEFKNEYYVTTENNETKKFESVDDLVAEFPNDFAICEFCGRLIDLNDNPVLVDNKYAYCNDECARYDGWDRCYDCGNWVPEDDLSEVYTRDEEPVYVCSSCYDNYTTCEGCECSYYHTLIDEDGYCPSCHDRYSGPIDDYHTFKDSEDYIFHHTNLNEKRESVPYMGFELEIDNGQNSSDCAEAIDNILDGFCHFEHDGSLGSSGFEIISHPASIWKHVENKEMYKRAWEKATSFGFSSHNAGSCGLHIHVDKSYFGNSLETSIVKILFLMDKFWTEFLKFSRRKSNQMRWCSKYDDSPETVAAKAINNRYSLGRYFALNLSNSDTIEFRIWRGTLKLSSFMATLKFTARICELAKMTSSDALANMTWEDLLGHDEDILGYWEEVKDRTV